MTADWRDRALTEARTWIGTPFHSGANLKGVGVDCGQFVFCVYRNIGLFEDETFPPYDPRWMVARENSWLEDLFRARFDLVDTPQPGDAMLFKVGRNYSHLGIVTGVAPPTVLHASDDLKLVLEEEAAQSTRFARHLDGALAGRPRGAI